MHPSDEQLYTLAMKINADEDLTDAEAAQLKHIAECDNCYHMICCLMAMQDVALHVSDYAKDVSAETLQVSMRETLSTALHLVVNTINSVLDQINVGPENWVFRKAPMAFAGARSIGKGSGGGTKKLVDSQNSQTYVSFDPIKKSLLIQIDSSDCEQEPVVSLMCSDGTSVNVNFEKVEHLYFAEICDLPEGDYEILLKK